MILEICLVASLSFSKSMIFDIPESFLFCLKLLNEQQEIQFYLKSTQSNLLRLST